MTDATTPEQPRTCGMCGAPVAVVNGTPRYAIEAQARPAAASEGLRAALEAYVAWQYRMPGARRFTLTDLRAALAGDAGSSVGALDVERLPESASIAEFRRRVREAIHPTSGMCGKNSTGCRTRHSLATIDCLNLLGRGEFALARLLLHEYDSARLAAAYDAEGEYDEDAGPTTQQVTDSRWHELNERQGESE